MINLAEADTRTVRSTVGSISRALDKQFNRRFGFILFLPSLLLIVGLFLFPMAYIFYLSLFEIGIFAQQGTFVGLENYITLATSSEFHSALGVGASFAIGSVVFQLILGMTLALLVNKSFLGNSLARTIAIFPYLIPIIAVVVMWKFMINPTYGALNYYAVSLGLINEPIRFFGSLDLALPLVIFTTSWKFTAFVALIILARLQAIDKRLYEQAKISGASKFQAFKEITLPNLRSAILLVVFLRSVFMFNKFAAIFLFTEGGPLGSTTNLPIFIYRKTFQDFNLGQGSAASIMFFSLLVVFATIYFWRFNPSEEVEVQ